MHSKARKQITALLLLVFAAFALALAGLYRYRSKSLFQLGGNLDSAPLVVFFNPLRDRSPEHAGESWLRARKRETPPGDAAICKAPDEMIKGWKLTGRTDLPQKKWCFLNYEIRCSTHKRYLFLNLDQANGTWHITDWRSSDPFTSLNEKIK